MDHTLAFKYVSKWIALWSIQLYTRINITWKKCSLRIFGTLSAIILMKFSIKNLRLTHVHVFNN